ncbi:toxin VasX [Marinobacter sp.]|uniref:toxin VasX n=1 Tax=Marinobacter sp. TaxID=50741 RepID=UPI0035679017
MERMKRPQDDRESGELKSWELPDSDAEAPATCDLMETVTLLPLRYGRTETPPPGSTAGIPYSLQSRPLGYRLLRDGYLYVYDEDAAQLREYQYQKNELSGGPMEYPTRHTLYVCFSDVAWTGVKKARITGSEEERRHWMQRVNLAGASACTGGEHLLTVEQASEWVAEFAEDYQPEPVEGGLEEEWEPYVWENQPYYHKTRVGKLLKQQGVANPDECLCLVVRDDVGVMLDLADHQDTVVGWLDQWASEGDNERDYVLGALIESMTMLDTNSLDAILESSSDPAIRAVREDLEALDPEARADTEEALLEVLNQPDESANPSPNDPSLPPELRAEVEALRRTANRHNAHGVYIRMQQAVDRWYFRESLEGADPAFVERNLEGLLALESQQRAALRKTLEGQGFGHRGINDLIDRESMDRFMEAQREKLARWQAQLDVITEDRVDMLCSGRLHRATWYFDGDDPGQVEDALDLQYACLKDICRADTAAEEILAWLESNPQFTHPLFQTIPLQDQSPDGDLSKTYATLASTGYGVVTGSASWIDRIRQVESGRLPQLEQLSELIQQKAEAIGDVLSPAVSIGMARSLQKLYEGIESRSVPELDDLFRDLPFFFKKRMLRAIEAGKAEFSFASEAELETFREDVRRMLALNERMATLSRERRRLKATHGHQSEEAQQKLAEFKQAREEHRNLGKRVAAGLSPVEESDPAIRIEDGAPGRATLAVVAPAAAQEEVGRLVAHFRQGLGAAPKVNLVGDGLGWLVFAAQVVNFWQILGELNAAPEQRKGLGTALTVSITATIGAGFLAYQGLMDTVYGARAKQLAGAWQRSAVKTVHIRMGRLHVGLGIAAYGAGFVTSAMAFVDHRSRWQEAVRRGNSDAQVGAVMGMVGSGGLTATSAFGFARTLQMGLAAREAKKGAARATAWASAGRSLSGLFLRLNLAGLIFTIFELAGTWVYNRYNLNERDQWLQSTPWGRDSELREDRSLEEYQAALARLGDSITLTSSGGNWQLNLHSVPAGSLVAALGEVPPHRVHLAAWCIQPDHASMFQRAPETWVPVTDEVMFSLSQNEDEGFAQLELDPPEHRKTRYRHMTREWALMVKQETRSPEGDTTGTVWMLKVSSSSDFPVTPVQEAPEGDVVWREVTYPLIGSDNS